MKLLLVMPTGLQVGYDEYFSSEPLGLETLAAYARGQCDVAIADMRGKGHDVDAHADELMAQEPDVIGISINSAPHTKYSKQLVQALRQRREDLTLLAGGQQATFLEEELLADGLFDALVRGEGELTLSELLQRRQGERLDFAGVAGVSWRSNGNIVHEPDREQVQDLDSVLSPAKDLLGDRSRYRMGKYRIEGVESSRGCPFQCSFCSIRNFHRGRWRPKTVQRVMQDVDYILGHYPERKVIYFADDNFTTDIKRVEAICHAIIERRSLTHFWCQARVDSLAQHPEVVALMGQARFTAVLVGIETPIPRLLKAARKGTSLEQVEQTVKLLHAHDIGVWGTFTLGLPGETPEETQVSAAYIPKANVDVAQITVATPVPGSTLFDEAKAAGDIIVTDWDSYDFTSPTMKGQLSKPEMDAVMHKAYLGVYTGRRFWWSLISQRRNVDRLRRTAVGVFWQWIWFLLKERLGMLLGRKQQSHENVAAKAAIAEAQTRRNTQAGRT